MSSHMWRCHSSTAQHSFFFPFRPTQVTSFFFVTVAALRGYMHSLFCWFTNLLGPKLTCFAPERMAADFIWSQKGKQEHGYPELCLGLTLRAKRQRSLTTFLATMHLLVQALHRYPRLRPPEIS